MNSRQKRSVFKSKSACFCNKKVSLVSIMNASAPHRLLHEHVYWPNVSTIRRLQRPGSGSRCY